MKKTTLASVLGFTAAAVLLAVLTGGGASGGQKVATMKNPAHARAIFDMRDGVPGTAALHMGLIHQTYKDLAKEGAEKPSLVVVFMGPSVKLITKNREGFSGNDKKALDEIAATVSQMSKEGIRLEVCLTAARVFGVDPRTILPEIKHMDNGWISEMGYQSEGYALVPVY